jgi:thiamine kinase-like enzyme
MTLNPFDGKRHDLEQFVKEHYSRVQRLFMNERELIDMVLFMFSEDNCSRLAQLRDNVHDSIRWTYYSELIGWIPDEVREYVPMKEEDYVLDFRNTFYFVDSGKNPSKKKEVRRMTQALNLVLAYFAEIGHPVHHLYLEHASIGRELCMPEGIVTCIAPESGIDDSLKLPRSLRILIVPESKVTERISRGRNLAELVYYNASYTRTRGELHDIPNLKGLKLVNCDVGDIPVPGLMMYSPGRRITASYVYPASIQWLSFSQSHLGDVDFRAYRRLRSLFFREASTFRKLILPAQLECLAIPIAFIATDFEIGFSVPFREHLRSMYIGLAREEVSDSALVKAYYRAFIEDPEKRDKKLGEQMVFTNPIKTPQSPSLESQVRGIFPHADPDLMEELLQRIGRSMQEITKERDDTYSGVVFSFTVREEDKRVRVYCKPGKREIIMREARYLTDAWKHPLLRPITVKCAGAVETASGAVLLTYGTENVGIVSPEDEQRYLQLRNNILREYAMQSHQNPVHIVSDTFFIDVFNRALHHSVMHQHRENADYATSRRLILPFEYLCDRAARTQHKNLFERLQQLRHTYEDITAQLEPTSPVTLIHTDAWPENIFVGRHRPLGDFAFAQVGPAEYDLATLPASVDAVEPYLFFMERLSGYSLPAEAMRRQVAIVGFTSAVRMFSSKLSRNSSAAEYFAQLSALRASQL